MQLFRPVPEPTDADRDPAASLDLTALPNGSSELAAAEDRLADIYSWPQPSTGRDVVVRANMIASLDGGATLDGRAGGLGTPIDQRMIGVLRDLADVVLVGAGTVLAEGYPGARAFPRRTARRQRWGRPGIPPWAIVATRSLPDDLPAVVNSERATIVISPDDVPQPAAAEVIRTGPTLDLPAALAGLADHGMTQILTEGGPTLLGRLLAADLLDELCLTLSPTLLGTGGTVPLLGGAVLPEPSRDWTLTTLLAAGDHLFTRYGRRR